MAYTIYGGQMGVPIDLRIVPVLPVSDEIVQRNIKNTEALALPTYREAGASYKPLAVVGGGLSIKRNLNRLRAFNGDIWGINGAFGWLKENGIDSTFFAVDPDPIVAKWCVGAKKALLETRIDPQVFELLKDADVKTFDAGDGKANINGGSSAVTVVPHLALRMGYTEITLFGCESNYMPRMTHAYQHEEREQEMIVVCNGQEFLTAPDFYVQAIELSRLIREVPEFVKEESDGLLRAMIQDEKHHIKWVSDGLVKTMSPREDLVTA